MSAGKRNIIIEKKATFNKTDVLYSGKPSKLNPTPADIALDIENDVLVPVNLTGATVVAKMKKNIGDSTPVITFTTSIVDAVNGKYSFSLTAAQTASLSVDTGVYDVLITLASNQVIKVVEGNVRVDRTAS